MPTCYYFSSLSIDNQQQYKPPKKQETEQMTAMLLLFGFSKALFDQSKVERVPKQKTVYKKHMFPLMYS